MNYIRLYKHSRKAMVDTKDHSVPDTGAVDYDKNAARVCAVQTESKADMDLSGLRQELEKVKAEAGSRPSRDQHSKFRKQDRVCYACNDTSHILRNCPHKAEFLKSKRSDQRGEARSPPPAASLKQMTIWGLVSQQ